MFDINTLHAVSIITDVPVPVTLDHLKECGKISKKISLYVCHYRNVVHDLDHEVSKPVDNDVVYVRGAMSPHTHARANENKLEKVGPSFSSSVGDFGRLFLSV